MCPTSSCLLLWRRPFPKTPESKAAALRLGYLLNRLGITLRSAAVPTHNPFKISPSKNLRDYSSYPRGGRAARRQLCAALIRRGPQGASILITAQREGLAQAWDIPAMSSPQAGGGVGHDSFTVEARYEPNRCQESSP
ncbi:hypothetical protein SKAU_G00430040 [Synaphobranchus kaupii]|uniref:Uncharacterized protein n=1 Tax=Synaphobranchus kaupii TaxID=118154 RepID=A0A9Q1I978_SYNKA|nr:hypothetical protein SKAU_G00430040 [Synaphobranchus kaupii]